LIFGYARVSTGAQKLETQLELLQQAGVDKIYQEKFTGTTKERPEFEKLLKTLRQGDTLVVTKLDRFARNAEQALSITRQLFAEGVKVNILNLGVIDDTPTGRLTFTIFSAFAQFERDMIVTRTQEGKAYAKAHNPNFHEGRPVEPITKRKRAAVELLKTHSYEEAAELSGLSRSTIWRAKKKIEAEEKDQGHKI